MRLVAPTRIDPVPLEAFRASLRVWLVEILVWLAHMLPARGAGPALLRGVIEAAERQLDADLRATTRDLRALLVAYAYAHMPALPEPAFAPTCRPRSVLRRAQHNSFLRKATATALKRMHAGSLKQRAERLRDALDNLEPLIAETRTHMMRLFKTPRVPGVLIAITHDAPAPAAPVNALACADTS